MRWRSWCARPRTGLAQEQVVVRRRAAAAGKLGTDVAAQAGLLDDDGGHVRVEFLRHDHRQRGLHALAGLGILGQDGDDVLGRDFDERVRRELPGRVVNGIGRLGPRGAGQGEAQGEAAAGEGGDADEITAVIDRRCRV